MDSGSAPPCLPNETRTNVKEDDSTASGDQVIFDEMYFSVSNRDKTVPPLKLIKDESDELTKRKLRELIEKSENSREGMQELNTKSLTEEGFA